MHLNLSVLYSLKNSFHYSLAHGTLFLTINFFLISIIDHVIIGYELPEPTIG